MSQDQAPGAIYLTEEDVVRLLPMTDAIEAVELAFRHLGAGGAVNRPRDRIAFSGGGFNFMAGADQTQGYLGYKAYGGFRGHRAGMMVTLYSTENGRLLAIMAANRLGQIRTGAASGVATRQLARVGPAVVGQLGTGFQGTTQLAAVATVREIQEVRVFSRNSERREQFAAEMGAQLGLKVRAVDTAEAAVSGADIVNVITNSATPVLRGAWLAPGTHINAAGCNVISHREIDVETVRRADLVVADSVEQARREAGDLLPAVDQGVIAWQHVRELADIVASNVIGRTTADEITLFESQGVAVEDVTAAAVVYRRAVERGLGAPLPF